MVIVASGPGLVGDLPGAAVLCVGVGLSLLLWPAGRHRALADVAGMRFGPLGVASRSGTGSASRSASRSAPRPAVVRAVRGAVPVMVVAVVPAVLSAPLPWVVASILAAATGARLLRRHRASARTAADLRQITAALRALVRELRAGTRPDEAARRIAADSPVRVAAMLEPLADMAFRPAIPAPGDVAARIWAAWGVAHRVGVPLADVLTAMADDLAARSAEREARAAQVAGPAVSGYVLALLPLAGLLLGAGIGSDPLAVLGSGGVGGALLVVGVALSCGGLMWADRIVRGGPDG